MLFNYATTLVNSTVSGTSLQLKFWKHLTKSVPQCFWINFNVIAPNPNSSSELGAFYLTGLLLALLIATFLVSMPVFFYTIFVYYAFPKSTNFFLPLLITFIVTPMTVYSTLASSIGTNSYHRSDKCVLDWRITNCQSFNTSKTQIYSFFWNILPTFTKWPLDWKTLKGKWWRIVASTQVVPLHTLV